MGLRLRLGGPEAVGMAPERVRRLVDLGRAWVESGATPALVLLAVHRGVVVLHEAFGRLGPEDDAPPLPRDAIYPAASMAKPITATAAMCLVEDGLLGLNRPVREYVPEFAGEGKDAVMVHHLLTHTSGLREDDLSVYAEQHRSAVSVPPVPSYQHPAIHEYLVPRHGARLWKPPGTEASYCNYNYNLVGEIVGRLSGRSLADFAAERILRPLGMHDTSYALPESKRHRLVGRPADASTLYLVAPERLETPWPHGGLFSTARDLGTFCQMFLDRGGCSNARVLSPASVAAMTRNQIPGVSLVFGPEFFPEASWGLGWQVQGDRRPIRGGSLCSPAAFGHNGAGGVYMWTDPTYELVGVYLSVLSHGRPGLLGDWAADLYVDALTAAVTDISIA